MIKILVALFIFLTALDAFSAEPILLGVLEQPQCKDDSKSMVRILFAKVGEDWLPLNNYEATKNFDLSKINWTVALHGQNVGNLKTIDPGFDSPHEWTYSRDRLFAIKPGQSIPQIANEKEIFSGWCSPPALRPVVVLSNPNFSDPAEWKEFSPENKFRELLFSKFADIVGEVQKCFYEPIEYSLPYSYTANELILFESYQDRFGNKLISLGLDLKIMDCDGPPLPTHMPNWFLTNGEQIRHIGNELEMIDAGDYDNDGKSEMFFWHSGYNEDGYVLFYDDFNKRANFYWNYH